jgi:hypothetical protein
MILDEMESQKYRRAAVDMLDGSMNAMANSMEAYAAIDGGYALYCFSEIKSSVMIMAI